MHTLENIGLQQCQNIYIIGPFQQHYNTELVLGKLPERNWSTSLKFVFNRLLIQFTKWRLLDFFSMNSGLTTGVLAIFISVGKKHSQDIMFTLLRLVVPFKEFM